MLETRGRNGQIAITVIVTLLLIINGLALFWLADMKTDVRDLRQNYFNALDRVSDLRVEITNLKGEIKGLNSEIADLKRQLSEAEKIRR